MGRRFETVTCLGPDVQVLLFLIEGYKPPYHSGIDPEPMASPASWLVVLIMPIQFTMDFACGVMVLFKEKPDPAVQPVQAILSWIEDSR